MRNFDLPGRSPLHATGAMAATSHPLATGAAMDVLRDGGNAIDAAVAACAVQCVVEPQSTGIGGDCFAIFAPRGSGEPIAYNGSGRAPAVLSEGALRDRGIYRIPRGSPHAVTVPGAVDAWARLVEDHGRKTLGQLLDPAIRYARDGYPVFSRVARDWLDQAATLESDPNAARIFLPKGRAPRVGEIHRQPELAATLERIARDGRDGFYAGPVAEDIVAYLNRLGGLHALDDFSHHAGEYVTPIHTTYRGFQVWECPPNGQGIVALQMLNILAGLDLAAQGPLSVDRLHFEIEAARMAYADRNAFVADPAAVAVPVERLLSSERAAAHRARIRRERAKDAVPPPPGVEHADTVYLCVVDEERNAVSFINSLFNRFGSGLVSPNSGVVLQNRGCGFVVEAGHPNCVAPGKRPLHTIIPGMLVEDGRAVMPFGVMGGYYQPVGHVHFLTSVLDFGLDLQEAIDLPRVAPTPAGEVEVESGVPAEVVDGLRARGHRVVMAADPIGGGQAIRIDWEEGVLTGASDPRKDGCVIGR
jgi:gamma-glutamyltranspeptidase / glutathione hydrolase